MLRSILFTALLALSASATAQDFDYNYFSIGYQRSNFDDGQIDADGDIFSASASFEISESLTSMPVTARAILSQSSTSIAGA